MVKIFTFTPLVDLKSVLGTLGAMSNSVCPIYFQKFGLNLRAHLWTEIECVSLSIQIHWGVPQKYYNGGYRMPLHFHSNKNTILLVATLNSWSHSVHCSHRWATDDRQRSRVGCSFCSMLGNATLSARIPAYCSIKFVSFISNVSNLIISPINVKATRPYRNDSFHTNSNTYITNCGLYFLL